MTFLMKYTYLFICLALLSSLPLQAQEPKATGGIFALTGATIETVTNGTVQGTLLIRDGKIVAIGDNVTYPDDATVIDCQGLTIYPGMIDGGTRIGLSEISSIELTQDYADVGELKPHMKALTAVNPNSPHMAITRMGGVTTALTVPSGGLFPGQAALINLYGYTPDAMAAGFEAIVMRFPSTARRGRRDSRSDEELEKDRKKALENINEIWAQAQEYHRVDSLHRATGSAAPAYYPEMAAMMPLLTGNAAMLIEVNRAEDILAAIEWVGEKKVKAILTGCAEGWRVAKEIAAAGIPVITGPVLELPTRDSDAYDRPYANPGIMQQAGVKVALRTEQTENVRNLPFHAGFAAAYGMGREEALRSVTIVPAEMFGLGDKLGSIEVGKVANLVIANGDIFEPRTQISHIFIDGWLMPYSSRQQRLYEEFLQRNP